MLSTLPVHFSCVLSSETIPQLSGSVLQFTSQLPLEWPVRNANLTTTCCLKSILLSEEMPSDPGGCGSHCPGASHHTPWTIGSFLFALLPALSSFLTQHPQEPVKLLLTALSLLLHCVYLSSSSSCELDY